MMRRNAYRFCAAAASNCRGVNRVPITETVGAVREGFELIEKREVPELHLTGFQWVHKATGAKYFHFDTDDQNNAFCVTFCTPATSDKGTTHVLEHTALCGSDKYPVRDPFFHMLRRSLNTFMNAMTGPDYTMYPFSTTNVQDYQNLLDVYLDAVLHPLLRAEDFRQEGHRLELAPVPEGETAAADSKTDEKLGARKASCNGVVFNEMRGVCSQPSTHFVQELWKETLPNTHYQYQSGGLPLAVLKLTHEELVSYHKQHYHPSNSIVMTYGDMPPWPHMKKINEMFSAFDRIEGFVPSKLAPSDRLVAPKKVETHGPPELMGELTKQKRVGVSYILPDELDESPETTIQLSVLSEMMTSGPNSPMYQALIAPQVGSRYCTLSGYGSFLSSPSLTFGVDGVDENGSYSTDKIEQIIRQTIEKAKTEGFSQKRLDSVVFQEELQQRHRSTSYGLNCVTTLSALYSTRRHLEPLSCINSIPVLKKVQADQQILLNLLDKSTTQNPHSVTLAVTSEPKYLEKIQGDIDAHEQKVNAELTVDDKKKLEDDNAQWLKRVQAPQDASVLPTLKVSDIAKDGFKEPEPTQKQERLWLIPHATNGLVYVHGQVPLAGSAFLQGLGGSNGDTEDALKLEHLRMPLCQRLLGRLGTQQHDFEEMEIETNLCSGGFSVGHSVISTRPSAVNYVCSTGFGFYTTLEKLPRALELFRQILMEPIISPRNEKEKQRLISLITSRAASSISGLQHRGHVYAMTRAALELAPSCKLAELSGGISQTQFLQGMQQSIQSGGETAEKAVDEVLRSYANYQKDVVSRLGLSNIYATCESDAMNTVESELAKFQQQLAWEGSAKLAEGSKYSDADFELPLNEEATFCPKSPSDIETVELPMDTNFVGYAIGNGMSFADKDQQVLKLACQILANTYLHRKVREEGGAYGAMANATLQSDAGGLTLGSYRDPTPDKTIETFRSCADWLADSANITEQVLSEAKLRLFAKYDAPMSPDHFGTARFGSHAYYEDQQKSRHELLAMTCQDIVKTAPKYFAPGSGKFAVFRGSQRAPGGAPEQGQ